MAEMERIPSQASSLSELSTRTESSEKLGALTAAATEGNVMDNDVQGGDHAQEQINVPMLEAEQEAVGTLTEEAASAGMEQKEESQDAAAEEGDPKPMEEKKEDQEADTERLESCGQAEAPEAEAFKKEGNEGNNGNDQEPAAECFQESEQREANEGGEDQGQEDGTEVPEVSVASGEGAGTVNVGEVEVEVDNV